MKNNETTHQHGKTSQKSLWVQSVTKMSILIKANVKRQCNLYPNSNGFLHTIEKGRWCWCHMPAIPTLGTGGSEIQIEPGLHRV